MKTALPACAAVLAAATALPACAQDGEWRALDPENTLYIEIAKQATTPDALLDGPQAEIVVIELAPDFAPGHVARIKELAREGFYDGRVFHRVIDGFMAQAGGLPGNPQGGQSGRPNLEAEFTARIGPDEPITPVQEARQIDPRSGASPRTEAGYWHGFPVAYQPAAQAMVSQDGRRDAWILHCLGAAASARTGDPNSANFQFYITRGESPWLDASYTAWGKVRHGLDAVQNITTGEPPSRPDTIRRIRVGADLPAAERLDIEVMRTESPAFEALVAQAREAAGGDINVCDVEVPVRIAQ